MGREILYCSSCQTQLREADFEKDRAFRIQNRAYCVSCAQGQIASLSPEQMKVLLRKVADPSTPAARPATVSPRPVSSTKMPRAVARKGGSGLIVGIALASAALVAVIGLALSSGRSPSPPSPPAPPPPAPPAPLVRPIPPPPPPVPRPAEVPDLVREIAAVDEQARPLLARESFKAAADLYELARGRHSDAQWKALLEGKAADARKEAQRLFDSLKSQAGEARKAGKPDQVKALQTRVAAWGLSDLSAALETHLASIPEPAPDLWERVFDGKTAGFLNPTDRAFWNIHDGAISRVPGKTGGAAQSAGTWDDGDFRFRFEVRGGSFLWFAVRQSDLGRASVSWNGVQIGELAPIPHELVFACRGEAVTATFDGLPVKVDVEGKSLRGHFQFNCKDGTLRLLAVDFRPSR